MMGAHHCVSKGSVMPQTDRVEAVSDPRLASIIRTAANLKDQLRELSKLRDQVRKAQLSARRSRSISDPAIRRERGEHVQ
jgi:hypothetical protein